jgi:hypothetical protein
MRDQIQRAIRLARDLRFCVRLARDPHDQTKASPPIKGSRRSNHFPGSIQRIIIESTDRAQQRGRGEATMKCIVELLDELRPLTPSSFAQRFDPTDINLGTGQRPDFENWLRRCAKPGRHFPTLDAAYDAYVKSFG